MKNFRKLSDAAFVKQNTLKGSFGSSRQSGKFAQDRIVDEFSRIAHSEVSESSAVAQSIAKAERLSNYKPTVTIDKSISPKFQGYTVSPLTAALMRSVTGNSKEKRQLRDTTGEKLSTVKIASMPNRGLNPEVKATVKISVPKNTYKKSLRELDIPESVIMACIRKAAAEFKANPTKANNNHLTFLRTNSADLVKLLRKQLKSGRQLTDAVVAMIA